MSLDGSNSAPQILITIPNKNANTPTPRNLEGVSPVSSPENLPSRTPITFCLTEISVKTVNTVATVLMAGIQAGTGAVRGIPAQLPNKINDQKVNSANGWLGNSRFLSFGKK